MKTAKQTLEEFKCLSDKWDGCDTRVYIGWVPAPVALQWLLDNQADARAEPLEVLRLFLDGCHLASEVHSFGQRCYWCGEERCEPTCARVQALRLTTEGDAPEQTEPTGPSPRPNTDMPDVLHKLRDAPERTEPTALEIAERVREACAAEFDGASPSWVGGILRGMDLAPILEKLGAEPGAAGGE
jgi:hypothetical protein